MFRIRFHGRGGQGVKTASRVLGTAFFREGFEVQDAPRYGPERRGAPIFAYVRAGRETIHERGAIARPDLVVVIDGTLLPLPSAGVLEGVQDDTPILLGGVEGPPPAGLPGRAVSMPALGEMPAGVTPLSAVAAAGAAARLTGVISPEALRQAVREELAALEEGVRARNLELALSAYKRIDGGALAERESPQPPPLAAAEWITLAPEEAHRASPTILAAATSLLSPTGLWRTERPVIDAERCKRCWWVCGTFCPDGAVRVVEDGMPEIDYDHCKGCLICLVQCPSQAITALPEGRAEAAL